MTSERAGWLAVVGLGPGDPTLCTPAVVDVLTQATDWVGYDGYLTLAAGIVEPSDHHELHRTDNREEADRARHAIALALAGKRVAVISSGDPGVFAMAAAVMEQIDAIPPSRLDVSIHPGVSAAHVVAARAGAPLGHDFAVISLSDNLKPWSVIERRLDAAAAADLAIALYNPRSRARPDQFGRAVEVLRTHRVGDTPVVLGRDVGRPGEAVTIVTIAELAEHDVQETVDMRTVIIVGSSQTRAIDGADGRRWVYTPRSYPD